MSSPHSHAAAIGLVHAAAGVSMITYEQAIAIYLRARGILFDGAPALADPLARDASWDQSVP